MPTTLPALCKCDDHARISNFDRVSPLSFDRYETGADSRLCPASILPLTRSVLPAQQVRVVRPSIVVAWRKNIRLETPVSRLARQSFFFHRALDLRSMLGFDRSSSLSSIAQRWWTGLAFFSHFPVPSVCSLRFRIHRYVSDLQDRV